MGKYCESGYTLSHSSIDTDFVSNSSDSDCSLAECSSDKGGTSKKDQYQVLDSIHGEDVHGDEKYDSPVSHEILDQRISQAIEQKEYVHWGSPEEKETNRAAIEDYDAKKRAVDKASLMTQKDTLTRYQHCFDQEAVQRMWSELGSNKTEIYNEPLFEAEKAPGKDVYRVVGIRDVSDGKICIRDCENMDTLKHTSSHETMHDLSFQKVDHHVSQTRAGDGELITISAVTNHSGIFKVETIHNIHSDGSEVVNRMEANRYLNEGMTEMYTIEAMNARGEYPRFDSYNQEVAWALQLREKVGQETFARAYFGGDVTQLEERVNSMSSHENAWLVLNDSINAYHKSISWYRPSGDIKIKRSVDELIENLMGDKEYGGKGGRQP